MSDELVLTQKGVQELEEKLEYLKTVRRQEIAEQIKVARSFGDLSENAEYDEARNEQSRMEGEIASIEATLKRAVVVDDADVPMDTVGIGSKVRILDIEYNEELEYKIFGTVEADPTVGSISNESPVGKALMGRTVGDEIEVSAPAGLLRFRILQIYRAENGR